MSCVKGDIIFIIETKEFFSLFLWYHTVKIYFVINDYFHLKHYKEKEIINFSSSIERQEKEISYVHVKYYNDYNAMLKKLNHGYDPIGTYERMIKQIRQS